MKQPLADCALCPRLCESRTAVVTGDGPLPCDVLVVAQAPGKQEEIQGKPLIGWSGKKLYYLATEIAGLDWSKLRRTNIVCCRPPYKAGGDLPPKPDEIRNCAPFLLSEITEAAPRLIITLGAPACKWFFPKAKFKELRGKTQVWVHPETGDNYDVCPMYHPAAAAPGRNAGLYKTMESEWGGLAKTATVGTYSMVSGPEAQRHFEEQKGTPFAFDFETEDNHWPPLSVEEAGGFQLNPKKDHTFQAVRARPIGWSYAFEEGEAFYCTDSVEYIRFALEDPDWTTYVHNALFEFAVCKNGGIALRGYHDTKLMAFLLGEPSTTLKDLSSVLLGVRQTLFTEVDWENIEEVIQYGAADSDYTLRLAHILEARLRLEYRLWEVYTSIDLPSVETLSDAQRDGFYVDTVRLATVRANVERERRGTYDFLVGEYGSEDINFDSGPQVADWLYSSPDKGEWVPTKELKTRTHIKWRPPGLGLPILVRTEGGLPSTAINTLHKYDHPVTDALIKYSSEGQFLSGHARNFLFLCQEDGRIHPSYHLSGHWEVDDDDKTLAPSTGRVSSTGPNAQQVTNYGDDSRPYVYQWGQSLRRCIQPAEGFVFLEADFAQQEPRIAAMVSGDTYMNDLLQTDDVYKPAAVDLYDIPIEEVTKDQRQIGKRAWMAWLNRAGPAGIQRSAWWLTTKEADIWLATQHDTYHVFTDWCAEQFAFLIKHGYVETWYGRRIYIPTVASNAKVDREAAYRACIPGVIQGTGADVFKLCLKEAGPYIHSIGGRTPLLIHDAIVAEVPLSRAQDAVTYLKGMSKDMMPSPLPIEVMQGFNWSKADMTEVF